MSLLIASGLASAQTITVSPLTTTMYCIGDSITIRYAVSGSFASDNHFVLQRSDANGSFASFTNLATDLKNSGRFTVTADAPGDHFRYRVISTSPYIISTDNGQDVLIQGYPQVGAEVHRPGIRDIQRLSLVGSPVQFVSTGNLGDSILWQFPADATPLTSTARQPFVVFGSAGVKWAKITATNRAGCSRTDSTSIFIADCHPTIPAGTRIVTGMVIGAEHDTSVLVKTGASYTVTAVRPTIYVEPGATVTSSETEYESIVYLMSGASEHFDLRREPAMFVLGQDAVFGAYDDIFDTARCSDLSFDYSQITSSVASEGQTEPVLSILADHRIAWSGAQGVAVQVLSILGQVIQTSAVDREHPMTLEGLPRGVYIIRSLAANAPSIRFVR